MAEKDTYKYHMRDGNRVVHRGVTNDLERRESEHRATWPTANIKQVGRITTKKAALKWEREGRRRSSRY